MKNRKTLTTNEVAKIFMVSDATVKRWAESGLLKSERTSGGHKRFRVDDVLKFQAEHGIGLKRRHGDDSPSKLARYRNTLRGEDSEFLNALLAGCEEEAGSILLSEYLNGKTIEQIFDELVCPVMRRVGELWFEGKINIAQEHLATRVVYNALYRLRTHLPVVDQRSELAFCCSFEGDYHELPTHLSQIVFESNGWEVMNFGSSMPFYSLADEAVRHAPDIICISATVIEDIERLTRDFAEFRSKLSKLKIPVILGGKVFEDNRIKNRFPADFYLKSFTDLCTLIKNFQK